MAQLQANYTDNTLQRQALQITAQSKQSRATAETILENVQNDDTLERMRKTYHDYLVELDNKQKSSTVNTIYQLLNNFISYGSQMYGVIQDQQTQQANAEMTTFINDFQGKVNESILAGTSRYVEDEQGNLSFQLDPDLQTEYDNYVSKIEGASFIKPVKDNVISALRQNFSAIRLNASTSALEQAYNDRNELFSANLNNALITDAQLLVAGNGELPEGAVFSGVSQILARTDWSQDRKDAAIASYMPQVMNQYAIEAGSSIAKTKGLQAAQEFIWSVPGINETQRQSALAYASNSLNSRASALSSTAVTMMQDAIEEGSSPSDVYQAILDNIANEAPEIKSAVYDQLVATQKSAVTEIASNQYAQDIKGGLQELQKTYDAYKAGQFDYLFAEIPEVEASFVSMYESAITSRQNELSSLIGTQDKEILSALDSAKTTLMTLVETGVISPSDAIQQYGAVFTQYASGLQTGSNIASADTAKVDFLSKLADSYLPDNWKTPVQNALDGLLAAVQLNGSTTNMTAEQIQAKNDITNYSMGLIADMFYSNSDYTLDDALAEIQNLKESVLMSGVAGNYTGLKMPAAEEGEPVTKNTSAAISLFSSYQNYTGLVYSDDASAMLLSEASAMLSEDKVGIPAVPKYKFISRQVEENFNNGAQALMPMIAAFTGEDISKITYAPEALANGSMLASPVYYAGGDMYRIRNETIQVNRDGQWAFAGFISTDDSQMRSQGQAFKQETALSVPEPEADVEKPETETPSRNVSSDTGFTGIVKDPFSQMLHADSSVFAGISTKEEAIRHRDEILEKYNSPMLKYEMDKLIKEIWGK